MSKLWLDFRLQDLAAQRCMVEKRASRAASSEAARFCSHLYAIARSAVLSRRGATGFEFRFWDNTQTQ